MVGAFLVGQKRILAEVEDQVSQLLTSVFENYKSLDETSLSGMSEIFPAVGAASPALVPAVQIYTLLHDILTLDAQITLRNYFKVVFTFPLLFFSNFLFPGRLSF